MYSDFVTNSYGEFWDLIILWKIMRPCPYITNESQFKKCKESWIENALAFM